MLLPYHPMIAEYSPCTLFKAPQPINVHVPVALLLLPQPMNPYDQLSIFQIPQAMLDKSQFIILLIAPAIKLPLTCKATVGVAVQIPTSHQLVILIFSIPKVLMING